ncbi:Cytochrome P450 [Dillenia turbinata]|uniref:Cytochrome P450 n=1 Tax=Dillenia turbinata TaxID=194707 RepID=A0AAN8US44_9MAGN
MGTREDVPHLPYIEAIVKETMRLHPVALMLEPRMSREDAQINGYDIPKGTRVLVNVWTIGRDPNLWDQPDEFYPEGDPVWFGQLIAWVPLEIT